MVGMVREAVPLDEGERQSGEFCDQAGDVLAAVDAGDVLAIDLILRHGRLAPPDADLRILNPSKNERKIVPGQRAKRKDRVRIDRDVAYTHAHDFSPNVGKPLINHTALDLAERINLLLRERTDLKLAAAESCTGGSVAQAITAFSGSSNYFLGGIVSYVNTAKHELLGVSEEILETRGAVSPECAVAMAEGARAAFHADIAISTTGIAGPTGATARKPVGLVYIALADGQSTEVTEHVFPGDRAAVTMQAAATALDMVLTAIEARLAESN